MSTSAVIIGAGPGGGATAVRLAQRGIRNIVLLDKDDFPREKTCGSALSPNGVKLIEELGLDAEVHRQGYLINSVTVKTPGGREMRFNTEQAAIILQRKHFDNLLVDRAKALGVEFRPRFKANELIREHGRVVGVRGRDANGAAEVRADYVLCADGAHSIFSWDPRPKQTISTLMGWWENFDFEPSTIEMVFDKNLAPLYGWMFPEGPNRVNIGICMDGEEVGAHNGRSHNGRTKVTRNVRDVFEQFLRDHYADRLQRANQIGKFKGHPISYTTWIRDITGAGILYLGEGARLTHNATGEGIYQAMQSGMFAADAVADVLRGVSSEQQAWQRYQWKCRQRFTLGFFAGHAIRAAVKTPLVDMVAVAYNSPSVRRAVTFAICSVLAGSAVQQSSSAHAPTTPASPPRSSESSSSIPN